MIIFLTMLIGEGQALRQEIVPIFKILFYPPFPFSPLPHFSQFSALMIFNEMHTQTAW